MSSFFFNAKINPGPFRMMGYQRRHLMWKWPSLKNRDDVFDPLFHGTIFKDNKNTYMIVHRVNVLCWLSNKFMAIHVLTLKWHMTNWHNSNAVDSFITSLSIQNFHPIDWWWRSKALPLIHKEENFLICLSYLNFKK